MLDLLALHGKDIDVGIVTTAASENTKQWKMVASIAEFKARLEQHDLQNLTLVKTLGFWGLTCWDFCRWADDKSGELPEALWPLIKPTTTIPKSHREFARQEGFDPDLDLSSPEFQKWRNKWCDVYSLEAHIAAGRDVFVSGDVKNFKGQKRDKLIELGVGEVCSYAEALEIAKAV